MPQPDDHAVTISLPPQTPFVVSSRPDACLALEWLETNGLGGFASSTLTGAHTRRYHGLLTASLHPPLERFVLLSQLEETLFIGTQPYDLSANCYPGTMHPHGYRFLSAFEKNPFPSFTYQVAGFILVKRIFMVHGENTTVVEYELVSAPPGVESCLLEIRPLIAFRDYHSLTHANSNINDELAIQPNLVSLAPYLGLPRLYFAHNAQDVQPDRHWYYNVEYPLEQQRGLDYLEDLFCPLMMRFDIAHRSAIVMASTKIHAVEELPGLKSAELSRRSGLVAGLSSPDPFVASLASAADQFIVDREEGKTVIAGYHWFGDWGRDTMISLSGLTLVTGRFAVARQILLEFAQYISQGMVPNRFPDLGDAPEYNTVDATLWYFEAIRRYVDYTGDFELVRTQLYEKLTEILNWHLRGTRYGIRMDDDGLLRAGQPGVQVTWMDAKVGDWVVTPRQGKPVEIQALWYNALRIMEDFATRSGAAGEAASYSQLASRAKASFRRTFWNARTGCLIDIENNGARDESIRPNQIVCLSLQHSMLDSDDARSILSVVEKYLLTPFGLRTLAPSDPNYYGHYLGSPYERDSHYHQGTVWPWLLGPFITASIRWSSDPSAARQRADGWVANFKQPITAGCLGSIGEITDGDAPFAPRGAIAQAWSVAEILRAYVEDIQGIGSTRR